MNQGRYGLVQGYPVRPMRFFRNLRYFVKPRGLVKIASNMGAVGVRFSYILGASASRCDTLSYLTLAGHACHTLFSVGRLSWLA